MTITEEYVNKFSRPSDLKITDLRVTDVNEEMLRALTDPGQPGYFEPTDE